jgi:uncharacterized protein YecE (DUF72 family)
MALALCQTMAWGSDARAAGPGRARERRPGCLRIGTSGFQYASWRGRFYPAELPLRAWLGFYAERFDSVEINRTFYQVPDAASFAAWRRAVPRGFLFALKFSRFGTHRKKLLDPEGTLAYFFERADALDPRMGPVLVQLPPRWRADPGRLDAFLAAAPRRRDVAVEVRDPRWLVPDVYAVLRRRGAALCLHDAIPEHPRELTADFIYLRFHGRHEGPRYGAPALRAWAGWLAARCREGLDAYAYFNNDWEAYAPEDAATLRRLAAREGAPAARAATGSRAAASR